MEDTQIFLFVVFIFGRIVTVKQQNSALFFKTDQAELKEKELLLENTPAHRKSSIEKHNSVAALTVP